MFDIQAAIDAANPGDTVTIPPGTYEVAAPIEMKNGVTVTGGGALPGDTIIRNTTTDGNTSMRACFTFGWFAIAVKYRTEPPTVDVDLMDEKSISDVAATDTHVALSTASDASNWSIGDWIWIASTETYELEISSVFFEMRTQNTFAKVVGLDLVAGTVTIDVPIGWSGPAEAVLLIPDENRPEPPQPRWGFVVDAHLSNVHCEGYSIVSGACGAINSTLRDITFATRHGFWTNCWANGVVENLEGTFEGRAFETKVGSSRSTFRNMNFVRNDAAGEFDHLFSIGEFQHNCTYENITINAGDWTGPYHAVQIQANLDTTIRNLAITCKNSSDALAIVYGDEGLPPTNLLIEDVTIDGGASNILAVGGSSSASPEPPTGVIRRFKASVEEKANQAAISVERCGDFTIEDSEFSHGAVTLFAGVTTLTLKDNKFPGPVGGAGSISNSISGNTEFSISGGLETSEVHATEKSGVLQSFDASYANAANGTGTFVANTAATTVNVGQHLSGGLYSINIAALEFDLTRFTDDDLIISASVDLTPFDAVIAATLDFELRAVNWTPDLTSSDWQTAAQLSAATLLAKRASGDVTAGANAFTNEAGFLDYISKTAPTRMLLVTSTQVAGTAPADTVDGRVNWYMGRSLGQSNDPKLTVTSVNVAGMTTQEARRRYIDAVLGLSGSYTHNEAWMQFFDNESIPAGHFNERQLFWINSRLQADYGSLSDAKHQFAQSRGVTRWEQLRDLGVAA